LLFKKKTGVMLSLDVLSGAVVVLARRADDVTAMDTYILFFPFATSLRFVTTHICERDVPSSRKRKQVSQSAARLLMVYQLLPNQQCSPQIV